MSRKRKLVIMAEDDEPHVAIKKLISDKLLPQPLIMMNCLNGLPAELKVLVFKQLDFKDLSVLSIVCKQFRDLIIDHFLLRKECLEATFKGISNKNKIDHFLQKAGDLGLLVKRATFILPNYKRVRLIISMFQMIDLEGKLKKTYETNKSTFKSFSKTIKNLLAKFIAGWKFKEVLKLIDEIELYFNNSKLLLLTMTKPLGLVRQDEQYLRYFYRKIIFECFEDNSTRAKWLNYFLNYHTNFTSDDNQKTTFQSKLLLLLFAPIFQDENSDLIYIDWFGFSTSIFLREGLEYLGFALRLLNSLKSESRPNVCGLFKSITNIGLFWLYENSSTLLFHCGIGIIKQFIDCLLKKDSFIQLVRYLTNLFIIESKLMMLNKIQLTDKITEEVFDYLKSLMHIANFESLMDLVTSEFLSMSRAIENLADDREYLEASEIIGGILQFYELRLKKKHLNSSSEFVNKQIV